MICKSNKNNNSSLKRNLLKRIINKAYKYIKHLKIKNNIKRKLKNPKINKSVSK